MQYKYEHTSVPVYSHFVQLEDHMISYVQNSWHKVHVGGMLAQDLEDLYAWCDVNIHHEWCVIGPDLYFQDSHDAMQLVLSFK